MKIHKKLDKLATDRKFLKIIEIAEDEFPDDPRVNFEKKLLSNKLSESTKDEKYTSYSVNKEKILFCLIARDNGFNRW